ncbi:universal stress protein [Phytohabitans kaempferiae]|uniref:Universal stress protein n=1 Tax=Phytohabitans kaempferiae TaxID=1620943 RepID=A0ABV6MGE2_9ACTN
MSTEVLIVVSTRGDSAGEIVVGVDGSVQSRAALQWAARQARLTGAAVHAITVLEHQAAYERGPTLPYEESAATAREVLTETVRDAVGPGPDVEIRESVRPGHPAQILVDASRDARALVVGSHGVGGFVGALLGSVSQHCAHHAHCPLVIIPGDRSVATRPATRSAAAPRP